MSDMDQAFLTRKFTQPMMAEPPQDSASRLIVAAHEEALYAYGEFAIFSLMWRPADFADGLVGHCTTCFAGQKARQAAAFQQPTKRECPDCFGTTFEGGVRAQIIRPMLMSDRNTVIADQREGTTETDTMQFETTSDFTFTLGDYVFRDDGSRYQCETKAENVVRTGFDAPQSSESVSGMAVAHLEAETAVAYLIPPADPGALLGAKGPFTINNTEAMNLLIRDNGYL